jgi:hypothetical protein
MSDEATPLNVPSTAIESIRRLVREHKSLRAANAKLLAVKEAAERYKRADERTDELLSNDNCIELAAAQKALYDLLDGFAQCNQQEAGDE